MNPNVRDGLLLIHISDVHCGLRFEGVLLQRAIDEINSLSPDIVVVTGDLTEEGIFSEFQEAKRYLAQIKCRRLVVGAETTTPEQQVTSFFQNSSVNHFQ